MVTKAELEAEVGRLTRSAAWYSGQYRKLKERVLELDETVADLSEQVAGYEEELEQQTAIKERVTAKAARAHAKRQSEMLKKRLEEQKLSKPTLPEFIDDADERLERCQAANAKLRKQIADLKAKLGE